LSFYVGIASREATMELAFSVTSVLATVGPGLSPLLDVSLVPSATILQVARLGDVTGSALDLVATPVTLTVVPANLESELEAAAGGAALLASFAPGGSTGFGEDLGLDKSDIDEGRGALAQFSPNPTDAAAGQASGPVVRLAPWARFAAALDDHWQELRARMLAAERANLAPRADQSGTASGSPRGLVPAIVDAAVDDLDESAPRSDGLIPSRATVIDQHSELFEEPLLSIATASMSLSMMWERAIVAVRSRRDPRLKLRRAFSR
jgi:hypothetical protein